ncbi:MAG: hypothetical protein ABIW47_10145 [Ginsengibacter sp.]
MATKIRKYKYIRTQSDALIHFLQSMDIKMIDSVLEPNRTYNDFDKQVFIQQLGVAFDELSQSGDTFLQRYPGSCTAVYCNYKSKGFTFMGNHSGNYFDLIIDIKNGVVRDIYECAKFECSDQKVLKNKQIKIDRSVLPFEP